MAVTSAWKPSSRGLILKIGTHTSIPRAKRARSPSVSKRIARRWRSRWRRPKRNKRQEDRPRIHVNKLESPVAIFSSDSSFFALIRGPILDLRLSHEQLRQRLAQVVHFGKIVDPYIRIVGMMDCVVLMVVFRRIKALQLDNLCLDRP